jgi:L-asparaginase II
VFEGDKLAVDGCGIPAYATTLRKAALSFARFATLMGLEDDDAAALARVAAAMADQPWYVGGTGRFDTDLLRVTRGRVVGKAGAEGVHCDALLDAGLGLALKVVDGARRAVPPATIAVLEALHALEPAAREALEPHARPPIVNAGGTTVGEIAVLADWLPPDVALP